VSPFDWDMSGKSIRLHRWTTSEPLLVQTGRGKHLEAADRPAVRGSVIGERELTRGVVARLQRS
jgi:hypothetical protein